VIGDVERPRVASIDGEPFEVVVVVDVEVAEGAGEGE